MAAKLPYDASTELLSNAFPRRAVPFDSDQETEQKYMNTTSGEAQSVEGEVLSSVGNTLTGRLIVIFVLYLIEVAPRMENDESGSSQASE